MASAAEKVATVAGKVASAAGQVASAAGMAATAATKAASAATKAATGISLIPSEFGDDIINRTVDIEMSDWSATFLEKNKETLADYNKLSDEDKMARINGWWTQGNYTHKKWNRERDPLVRKLMR